MNRRLRQSLPLLILAIILALGACDGAESAPRGGGLDVITSPTATSTPEAVAGMAEIPTGALATNRAKVGPSEPVVQQAIFDIGPINSTTVRRTSLFEEVQFSAPITNVGGAGGEFPILVTASLDGANPEPVHTIDDADAGSAFDVHASYRLRSGNHLVEFAIDNARQAIYFNVSAADLDIRVLPHRVIGDRQIEVRLELTNRGQSAASDVQIYGSWGPAPREYNGGNLIIAFVAELQPGANKVIDVPIRIPAGHFRFEVVASSRTLEGDPNNNDIAVWQGVLFDQIRLHQLLPPKTIYQAQNPEVEFTFVVEQQGNGLFDSASVGLARKETLDRFESVTEVIRSLPKCSVVLTVNCWWEVQPLPVQAGGRYVVATTLPLEIGLHSLVAFAAGPNDPYRLGAVDVLEINQQVPPGPEIDLDGPLNPSDGAVSPSTTPLPRPPVELGLAAFYQKFLVDNGIVVASSPKVPDEALIKAGAIANEMLAFNADVRRALADTHIAVIAQSEQLTDVPEYKYLPAVFPGTNWNRRARGLGGARGGTITSTSEENLLCYPDDGYRGQDLLVHEFAHTVWNLGVLRLPDGWAFASRLNSAYRTATDTGLWRRTYAATNEQEYWAVAVQAWFNVQITPRGDTNAINTREELKAYDPTLAGLIEDVFGGASLASSCHQSVDENDYYLVEGTIASAVGQPLEGISMYVIGPDGHVGALGGVVSTGGDVWTRLPKGSYQLAFAAYDVPGSCWIGFYGAGGWTLNRSNATWIEVSDTTTPVIEIVIPKTRESLCGRATF